MQITVILSVLDKLAVMWLPRLIVLMNKLAADPKLTVGQRKAASEAAQGATVVQEVLNAI
jgi:hypothetical protein